MLIYAPETGLYEKYEDKENPLCPKAERYLKSKGAKTPKEGVVGQIAGWDIQALSLPSPHTPSTLFQKAWEAHQESLLESQKKAEAQYWFGEESLHQFKKLDQKYPKNMLLFGKSTLGKIKYQKKGDQPEVNLVKKAWKEHEETLQGFKELQKKYHSNLLFGKPALKQIDDPLHDTANYKLSCKKEPAKTSTTKPASSWKDEFEKAHEMWQLLSKYLNPIYNPKKAMLDSPDEKDKVK